MSDSSGVIGYSLVASGQFIITDNTSLSIRVCVCVCVCVCVYVCVCVCCPTGRYSFAFVQNICLSRAIAN